MSRHFLHVVAGITCRLSGFDQLDHEKSNVSDLAPAAPHHGVQRHLVDMRFRLCGAASPAHAKTLTAVMHSDLRILDPIFTGAYITRDHGYMVYDTLLATDSNFKVQPQMADWKVSDDKLTYTFTLARRTEVARRQSGHRGGLCRLAQALEQERNDGPSAHGLHRQPGGH